MFGPGERAVNLRVNIHQCSLCLWRIIVKYNLQFQILVQSNYFVNGSCSLRIHVLFNLSQLQPPCRILCPSTLFPRCMSVRAVAARGINLNCNIANFHKISTQEEENKNKGLEFRSSEQLLKSYKSVFHILGLGGEN